MYELLLMWDEELINSPESTRRRILDNHNALHNVHNYVEFHTSQETGADRETPFVLRFLGYHVLFEVIIVAALKDI